jgi:hypothetical protein
MAVDQFIEANIASSVRGAVETAQTYPWASHPYLPLSISFVGGALLLRPTRRWLYRTTLGRLRSAENILASSEGRVDGLKVKATDLRSEADKLVQRMRTAEEEYIRGRKALRYVAGLAVRLLAPHGARHWLRGLLCQRPQPAAELKQLRGNCDSAHFRALGRATRLEMQRLAGRVGT